MTPFAARLLAGSALALALAAAPASAKRAAPAIPTDDRGRFEFLAARVAASWDLARGGFVSEAGLPSETAVELGFLMGREAADPEWTQRSLSTVDWTRSLMDSLGGGFATRRQRPGNEPETFGMRTDVNTRRLANLAAAWRAAGDDRYRRDAMKVAAFVDRVLIDGRGGFVTAPVGDRNLQPAANGVAIHAWLVWAATTGDTRVRDFALRSIERVWETCFDARGVLLQRGDFGEVMVAPQLLDQVEMGRALVYSSRLCDRPEDLKRALALGHTVIGNFPDPKRGAFMTQAMPKKDGTIRHAPCRADENARAARFLVELAAATGNDTFRAAARRAWEAFAEDQHDAGLEAADWALAFHAMFAPEAPEAPAWQTAVGPSGPTPNIIFRTKLKGR
jgi:uncharacterized protein YyaL (SSP411 family)